MAIYTVLYALAIIVTIIIFKEDVNQCVETTSIVMSFIALVIFSYALCKMQNILVQLKFVKIKPIYTLLHILFVVLYIFSNVLFEYFLYR